MSGFILPLPTGGPVLPAGYDVASVLNLADANPQGVAERYLQQAESLVANEAVRFGAQQLASLQEGLRDMAMNAGLNLLNDYQRPGPEERQAVGGYQGRADTANLPKRTNAKTPTGAEWVHPIAFVGGPYDYVKDGVVEQKQMATWWLPATTFISQAGQGKEIAKSQPQASKGSTKEEWAFDDHEVVLQGVLLTVDPMSYPRILMRKLAEWQGLSAPVRVVSQVLADMGVTHLVLERYTIQQTPGRAAALTFTIYCTSDEDPAAAVAGSGGEFGRGAERPDAETAQNTIDNFLA